MLQLSFDDIFPIMEKYKRNEKYFADNYEEMIKKHNEEFIAIDDGKVIGSNNRFEKLLDELNRNNKNTPTVLIKLISEKKHRYMI